MFDFDNTPITHYTKLQAQWNCGGGSLTYYGDWARVTLTDGTVLEAQSQSELNSLLTSTTTATVDGTSINVSNIRKIEFGTKVTDIPNYAIPLNAWTSLTGVSGFHEGLQVIGTNFMCNAALSHPEISSTIIIPSTVQNVGTFFMYRAEVYTGMIVVNCAASKFSNTGDTTLQNYNANSPSYVKGVAIGGEYATDFITRFPNLNNTNQYRNLYKVDTFNVSFNAAGGVPEPATQVVVSGKKAKKPSPDPEKEGTEFVGWFEAGKTYDFDLYGEIPVVFNVDGGSPEPNTQYVMTGEHATEPEAPEKEGYEFDGWYARGEVFTPTPVLPVIFNTDGAEEAVTTQYILEGGHATEPPEPAKEGYEFIGWFERGTIPDDLYPSVEGTTNEEGDE